MAGYCRCTRARGSQKVCRGWRDAGDCRVPAEKEKANGSHAIPPPPPPAPKAKQPFLPRTATQLAKGWSAHNANLHATIAAKQATTFACVPAGKHLASRKMLEPCAADDYDMSFQRNELDAETYSMLHSVDGEFGGDRDRVVIGSLKKNVQFWEEIGAPKLVLEVINNGYTLPFVRLPRPRRSENHKSTHEFPDFVGEAISDMRSRGCIKEVNRDQVSVCSPLGVVDNGKKLRLILDLRYLNKHLAKFKYKLEDLKVVADVYEKNDFLVTFDLKSGYHHIAIAESHWRYLGFSWVTPREKQHTIRFVSCRLVCQPLLTFLQR